ncbi:hypothetical protein PHISP_02462 [Aspergillus sp. HF37]|nr:hypothetical protein PHISP_02462 [Aspergillus sp. HF37]
MDIYQRNTRLVHHISEFLDLDSTKPHPVSEFISLIDALREGLQQIDDGFRMPDTQLGILFLSKLKARPEWSDWAAEMMRDPRLNSSDPAARMTFQQLADRAVERERLILGEGEGEGMSQDGLDGDDDGGAAVAGGRLSEPQTGMSTAARPLSQDEINAFVIRKMSEDKPAGQRARGHIKRPSQEEINEYVVRQMRREQERVTRNRSQSHPVASSERYDRPRIRPRCGFCGDPAHAVDSCWRRWRVAVDALQGNFAPKRMEFRTEIPGDPPIYRTGFSLF